MILTAGLSLSSCGRKSSTYEIDVSGTLSEPGVIKYLGYSMNVYKDAASNPCGSCPYQPVSVYSGSDAAKVLKAIDDAVVRYDDVWTVVSRTDKCIVLKARDKKTIPDFDAPSAPKGLTITGEYK